MLLPIYSKLGFIFRRKGGILIQVEEKQELEIRPLKHWLSRPFQGIGIGLLFATKLLGVLQIATGSAATASLFLPQGQFQLVRLLIVSALTILVSIVLSTLWTMDDLGIRYFNRKDYEIKMIGKYVGTLMPIAFGVYGVFSLFDQFSKMHALIYLFQMVVILYPSFTIFSVFHAHFVQRKAEELSKRLNVEKWRPKDKGRIAKPQHDTM
jgi:4-amino-4-deoxy-L-arabinose transferase-like glycosyltransferase